MKKTLAIFVVAAGLATLAHFSLKDKETRDKQDADGKKPYNFTTDDITIFTLETAKGKIVASKVGGAWRIDSPIADRANAFAITNLIDNVKGMEIDKRIPAKGKALADFALEPANATITLTGKGGVQYKALIGMKNPQDDHLYAMKAGGDEIYLIGTVLDTVKDKELKDFRDKKLFDFGKDDLTGLALVNPQGSFELGKPEPATKGDARTWRVLKPIALPLATTFEDGVFTPLFNAELKDFVAEQMDDPKKYGFDKPYISGSFTLGGDKPVRAFAIGKTVEKKEDAEKDAPEIETYYLQVSGSSRIVSIDKETADRLNFPLGDLIEKKLLAFDPQQLTSFAVTIADGNRLAFTKNGESWGFQASKDIYVDKGLVDDILQDIRNLERERIIKADRPDPSTDYGFATPLFSFQGYDAKGDLGGFTIGKETTIDSIPQYYATNTQTGFVFTITKADFDDLPKNLKAFRTKTATTLDKYDLVEIRLQKGKDNFVLKKAKDDHWILISSMKTIEKPGRVFDFLDFIGQLYVEEFITSSQQKMAELQLTAPSIKLWLKDRSNKTQEVSFGARKEGNLIYAKRDFERDFLTVKAVPLDNMFTLIADMQSGKARKDEEASTPKEAAPDMNGMDAMMGGMMGGMTGGGAPPAEHDGHDDHGHEHN